MTREEKDLLLNDLCARLPHKVFVAIDDEIEPDELFSINTFKPRVIFSTDRYLAVYIENIKPYLRPMSSMTNEEKKELGNYVAAVAFASQNKDPLYELTREAFLADFFNKHHIDYHGLIPMGLAFEAPENMYI